ncbi:hypothetical protein [Chenggangzhangella methanolivorans]|uniref:Motility protein n=1 Tax=Chenggangzhangella methanolivorans TaxID=1437009 RepID=A0A9E6R728_9HYPH|nr:hypothetical protein [Chenggangzhangella methanolivorans]QZN98484.1 hypothetical protein K6K41_15620 [Chenggangzhangella methanolivorans]
MEISSLAASAVASNASQTRDGFQIAALKIANQQQQMIADMVTQSAETTKALNQAGVGGTVDRLA